MKEVVEFLILAIMLFWETRSPLFPIKNDRWLHATYNIGIKLFNMIVIYLLFSVFTDSKLSNDQGYGLFNLVNLPGFLKILIVFLVCDLYVYCLHVANHKIPVLWKIHRAHHADDFVDATTVYRRHFAETAISNIIFILIISPVFGISFIQIVIYQMVNSLIGLFHHGNIVMPKTLDNILKTVIVTPNMHRVHHSDIQIETDSNYGTVFSFWDRIFKTYRNKENLKDLKYGLKEFTNPYWQTFKGVLSIPFA